jgi:hypothetical protein
VGFSAALAARAQIISVTTAEMGPAGPVKRLFAVAVDTRAAALEEIERRLKQNERAIWVDVRTLTLQPGEVRRI